MSSAAAMIYAPVLAVSLIASPPHLTARSWVFLAGTAVLQTGYFLFLLRAYRVGDLSAVYPIGRGSGALLAALAGVVLLGERPGPAGLAGIGLLVTGVIVLGMPARTRQAAPAGRPAPAGRAAPGVRAGPGGEAAHGGQALAPIAILFALVTGIFIAAYTLWDKIAVTTVGNPPLLQGYASLLGMALVLAPFALADTARTGLFWHRYRGQVLGAGLLSPLAYILVLVAMTFTSVAAVAPAREVSVLFGVLLGRRLLGEGALARRLIGAAAIVAGIIAVTIG
jgi:drug/metabolite transporter (DMT)-like permease